MVCVAIDVVVYLVDGWLFWGFLYGAARRRNAGSCAGFWIGFYLAAVIGAFFVPICGLLAGLFRLRGRKSLRMMTIAGGATGLVSGVVLGPLCLLTCVCGAMGAALPGKSYLARRGSPDHSV